MKVIVAGSTIWDDRESIRQELAALPSDTTVIFGDSPGADQIGGEIASELNLKVQPMSKHKDDYQRYKRGAWKALNERMLASDAELVLAFHPDLAKSRGTKHLVKLAQEAGVPVKIIAESH